MRAGCVGHSFYPICMICAHAVALRLVKLRKRAADDWSGNLEKHWQNRQSFSCE